MELRQECRFSEALKLLNWLSVAVERKTEKLPALIKRCTNPALRYTTLNIPQLYWWPLFGGLPGP